MLETSWTEESLQNLSFRICMTWAFPFQTWKTEGNSIASLPNCWVLLTVEPCKIQLEEGQWHPRVRFFHLLLLWPKKCALPLSPNGFCSTFQALTWSSYGRDLYYYKNTSTAVYILFQDNPWPSLDLISDIEITESLTKKLVSRPHGFVVLSSQGLDMKITTLYRALLMLLPEIKQWSYFSFDKFQNQNTDQLFCKSIMKHILNMNNMKSIKSNRIDVIFLSGVCIYIIVKKLGKKTQNQTGNMNLFMDLRHNKPGFYIHIFSYVNTVLIWINT